MMLQFFEQFKGDVEYVDPWHDPRAVSIFEAIGVTLNSFQSMPSRSYHGVNKYQIDWCSELSHDDMERLLRKTNGGSGFKCERIKLAWQPKLNFLKFDVEFIGDDQWKIITP